MLSLLKAQLKATLAANASFAIRWRGEAWSNSYSIGDGDMPYNDADKKPLAAIEAEISGFRPVRSVGPKSMRVQTRADGHLRLILSVGLHSGTTTLDTETDTLISALSRKNVYYDALTVTRIYLMDVRVDDEVGFYEEGNRTVRMLTIPWKMSWFS